jgi:hypothetical protein
VCIGLNWAVLVQVHGQHTDSRIKGTTGVIDMAAVALGRGSNHAIQRRWAVVRLSDRPRPDHESVGDVGDLDQVMMALDTPPSPLSWYVLHLSVLSKPLPTLLVAIYRCANLCV